jgi:hypothetical protein
MNCVNKSSKEFKALATKHNVSDNTLELIIHKYWREKGTESHFPSDSYIQAQLGAIPYEESVKAVRKLWRKKYSGLNTYNTFEDLQKAIAEVSKYFPAEAVVYYKNVDGKYSLVIKEPVVKLNKTLEDIQKKGYLEARKESIDTENNKEYSVDKAKELFNKFNADRTSLPLADKVFKLADTIGIKVVFSNSLKDGNIGAFGHNTIILNKDFYENSNSNDKKAATILHEIIHAITTYAISDKVDAESLSKPLQEFRKDINQLFTELQYNPVLKDERGILNEKEFIAELSNPVFRQKIQTIDNNRKESFWQRIVNAIKKLLGIHSSSPYYTRMMNTLDKAINAFDVKTYMEYNGLTNALKQGTNDDLDYNTFIKNQKELDDIKAKAIKNGAFMKAPNGKPTNLNEQQWLQVRTKAFKDWFGDWEKGTIFTANNVDDIEELKRKYPSTLPNKFYHHSTNKFGRQSFDSREGTKERLHIVGRLITNKIDALVVENPNSDNKISHITLATAKGVKPFESNKELQLHKDKIQPLNDYVNTTFRNNISNDVSKVVDENGEPLVVYHGTTTPNITKFDLAKTRSGGAFWFANKEAQKVVFYTGQDSKDIIMMPLFINMRTPLLNNEESMEPAANDETHDGGLIIGKLKDFKEMFSDSGYFTDTEYKEALDKGLNADSYLATGNVANPNQLKSAVYNNGDFSRDNDNIDYNTLSTEDIKNEIHSYVDNLPDNAVKSKETLHSFINDLTESDVKNIYNEIEQNRNDVNLVVGKLRQLARDKKPKSNQKYFTFKDGKSVKAPFVPNDQQAEALDKINDFLHSSKDVMTLSGYAGTGKTSIMEMIAEKASKDGMGIVFTASTNKATQVLETKVGYLGFPVMTANKAFGIALEPGDKATYDANDLKTVLVENKIDGYNAAIIDEASMINQHNFKILNEIARTTGLKIIYVGDPAQLSPVKDSKKSPVFTSGQGEVVTLTKVERTGDNAILEEATNIRNGGMLSGISSFNKEGKGVAYIKPGLREMDEIIKTFIPKLSFNPDYFRILTYSNKSVAQYNEMVRKILGYTDNVPRVGEPIIGYTNYDYNFKTKKNNFVNSGSYRVVRVGRPIEKNIIVSGQSVSLTANPVTIVGIDGAEHTYDMVDIKGNEKNKKAIVPVAQALKTLWARWKGSHNRGTKAELLKEIHKVESYLFVNDDIYDDAGHTLLNKRYDFGYAMTIHKSQGSTFNNVLLDDINVAMYNNYLDKEALKQAATKVHHSVDISSVDTTNNGIAAAHSNIDNAEVESSTDVDIFGDGNTQGTNSQTNTTQDNTSDMVDIRRQLEYVGVSRASNTVTIISNDVKKEGSPLHPEDTPTESNTTNSNNESKEVINNTGLYTKSHITSITPQLIEHLRSIGIDVNNRAAMEEYLKANGYDNIEAFIDKKTINKEELAVLGSTLMTKYHNKKLYRIVEHTANYEYIVNYKGEGEFDIVEYHLIDNNAKNEINDREGKRVSGTINRLSSGNEVTQGKYSSDNYDVTDTEANGNNAKLDSKSSQGEPNKTQDNASGNKHQEWSKIKRDSATGRISFIDSDGRTISTAEDWNKDSEFFVTPSGEVYGFVTLNGRMFLDETKITSEHPIHEYTHLWDRALQKTKPKLWNRGVELMKQTSLWKTIEEDANYGAKWKKENLSQEELDNRIASEVHARFVGKGGADLLDKLAKEKGQEGIIAKLKDWILEAWKSLKATFSDWSKDEINKLTLKDFNHMTMRDFAEGINPNTINSVQKVLSDKNTDMQKTLSLPNFEHFAYNRAADKLEGIKMDAPWKEHYLKDLDSQFRRMESEDEEIYMSDEDKQHNQKLIDKMKVILNAKDKDDYLNKEKREYREGIEAVLSDYDRLNKQYSNLLNGMTEKDGLEFIDSPLGVYEIRHIAELIMDSISDVITDIQTKDGYAEELFPNLKTKEGFDFKTATRQEVIEAIGIENLLNNAKKQFDTEQNDWFRNGNGTFDASLKADFIFNNWDAMVKMGADVFAFNEGLGISRNYSEHRFKTSKESQQLSDNFNENLDEDSLNEIEGNAQEHWQVDSKTIDTMNSMSALVRKAIHECYDLDENGNVIINKLFGIKERIDARKVTNSILRWTQGSLTIDDMINRLSTKMKENPWLSQLINRLQDNSGVNTDIQSQFFGVFCKHFQLYSIVIDQNGKYTCINANAHPALTEIMNGIKAKYNIGEHPLFTSGGKINRMLLGNDNTIDDSNPFNLHQALAHLPEWNFKGTNKEVNLSPEKMGQYAEWLAKAMRAIGYDATPDMVASVLNKDTLGIMVEKLHFIVHDLSSAVDKIEGQGKEYKPFEFKSSHNIGSAVQNFLSPVANVLEDTAINAFYDSGKMYQSYVTPSFTTKLLQKFKLSNDKDFFNFMKEEYGKSEWFGKEVFDRMAKGMIMRWNVPWLAMMGRYRKEFDHRVQLNFNGHNYMRNLSDPEYALSVITEYYSESAEQQNDPAWFRIPMESNKPSEEFIRFMSYRNKDSNIYKTEVVEDLSDMVFMEISRIQTVRKRNLSEEDEGFIKNFDDNGRRFCFFPFLNAYMEDGGTILRDADGNVTEDNKTLTKLLKKKIAGEEALTASEDVQLSNLIKRATRAYMQERVDGILDMMDRKGIIQAARKIKNISDTPETLEYGKDEEVNAEKEERINAKVKSSIENFLWNDYLASKNILMIMVGDTAFYKDAEDLQKRLAELHAPGIRGNINAVDYNGNKVSDGKYRTIILKDFDDFKSNIIANLEEIFDRKIAQAKPFEKAGMMALKEDIIRAYSEINVADAEGYSCMTSYRKKALMFGKWSKDAEEIYKRILDGTYTYTDLKTAFQPMKPFVYTHLQKNMNVEKAPISMMYCPFQAKNSEVLLVIADALLKNEKTSRPNLLRAISNIMEDSAYDGRERDLTTGKIIKQGTYNGNGIDTVQFESAIKSSLQTPIDLNQFIDDKKKGETRAYTRLKTHIYQKGTTNYDVDNYVQEASFEDYCIQQEIPEHFKNHSQAHGSQMRMIIPSDLDYYYDEALGKEHPEDESNIVKYEWTDDSGRKHSLNANEFRHHYESTIAENILNSLDNLAREFRLEDSAGHPIEDKKERNIALSQILVREIDSSPRYGIDLRWACSLNDEGEFNIPLGDPIQCKRIEQLINSIIKNRVNKQEIAGGPIVQVSNYGASKQLHIRLNDKNGKLMPTEEEFNKAKKDGTLTDEQKKYGSYKDYIKENQGGIAYYEVFAPIWSDEIAEKFMDKDGNIDMKAIEETNPEMLKLITYRIPTEDKYSMAPCKIVGFMPRQAGDTIMLPYELTSIDGSDFDIDKRYVMRKDYRIIENKSKIGKELYKRAEKLAIANKKGAAFTHDDKVDLHNKVDIFLDTIGRTDADRLLNGNFDKELKRLYQEIHNDKETMKHCYTTAKVEKNSKQFNDNEIVNMSWTVLTNPTSADKMLNPGGFELQKKVAYMIAAYKNPANAGASWDKLHALKTKELKKLSYVQKDLAWFDTQMQFYKQNSAAATLIGIFAVNKIAHAVLEADDFYIDIDEICGSGFSIANTSFKERMKVDPRHDTNGNLIGKVLGSLVGASADAVKDPVLNLMNINSTTAGMLNTMIRLGLPFEDAVLFLSQDIIIRVIDEFNKRNLSNYVTIDDVINGFMEDIEKETGVSDNSNIAYEPIFKQELIDGLREGDHKASDYKVLLAFTKLKALTESMRNITFATRFNSISSAVGPLVVDNLIMEHKISNFLTKNNPRLGFIKPKDNVEGKQASTGFYSTENRESPNDRVIDINDVWNAHPILGCFKDTVRIANQVFEVANMPTNNVKFRTIIASLQKYGLLEKVFTDKKLLDQLSTFYQSYMLMASNLIDSKNLGYYIDEFPKKFLQYQKNEKYKDNALIQAIKLNYSRQTGKPFLQIKITGMDAKEKEELGSAWVDLHKQDPQLSTALFQYSFFRAGIGFSPKTFMALVPVYVKNHLSKTLEDGTSITYKDVYKGMFNDRIVDDNVIDQFIRNNWNNNKLVPWVKPKDSQLRVNYSSHIMTVSSDNGFKDLMGKIYVKTSANGTTYLWKKEGMDWDTDYPWVYKQVSPLGNNGEYLEISTAGIKKSYSDAIRPKEKDNEADADMKKSSPLDDLASGTESSPTPAKEEEKKAATLSEMFINFNSNLTQERIDNLVNFYKKGNNAEKNVGVLQKIFRANGLELNNDETIRKFKELC